MPTVIPVTSLFAIAMLVSACSDNAPSERAPANQANTNMADNTAAPAAGGSADQTGALGLTMKQLGDAEIISANGVEIGEVERVITDSAGVVTHLLVEIEDTDPDRFVELPLDGLTPKQVGDDWDLETKLTRDDLMALPEVK